MTKDRIQQLIQLSQREAKRSELAITTVHVSELENLSRLALANLETQEWLVEVSAFGRHNHTQVALLKRLRGEQP
jgi:hypothetical protein